MTEISFNYASGYVFTEILLINQVMLVVFGHFDGIEHRARSFSVGWNLPFCIFGWPGGY